MRKPKHDKWRTFWLDNDYLRFPSVTRQLLPTFSLQRKFVTKETGLSGILLKWSSGWNGVCPIVFWLIFVPGKYPTRESFSWDLLKPLNRFFTAPAKRILSENAGNCPSRRRPEGSKYPWENLWFWKIVAFWKITVLVGIVCQFLEIGRKISRKFEKLVEGLFGTIYSAWESPYFKHLWYMILQKKLLSRPWTAILDVKLMDTENFDSPKQFVVLRGKKKPPYYWGTFLKALTQKCETPFRIMNFRKTRKLMKSSLSPIFETSLFWHQVIFAE